MKDLAQRPSIAQIVYKYSWSESRVQLKIGGPIMAAYLLQMGLQLTNTIMIGHMPGVVDGAKQVAAAGLAMSFNNVTGSAIGIGLATALDTRLSQAFTMAKAKRLPSPFKVMNPILHRFLLIAMLATIPIIVIWLFAEKILGLAVPDSDEIPLAARYTLLSIPGLFPYFGFEALKKYVQAQGHTTPILLVLLTAFLFNLMLSYFLIMGPVDAVRIGFDGAAVATVISQYLCPVLLLIIMKVRNLGTPLDNFFDRRILQDWMPLLRLGIPGVAMLASEWWAFEICVVLAAKLGTVPLAAQTITQQIAAFAYMIPLGVSIAATTRVGNMIGAGCGERARVSAMSALILASAFSLFNSALLISLRAHLGRIFSDDTAVVAMLAQVLPICGFFQIADGLACVASGVLKGTGKQKIGAAANLMAYYAIGLPIGLPISGVFSKEPKLGLRGFWWGLCIGLYIAAAVVCFVLFRIDWADEVRKSYEALSKDTAEAAHDHATELENGLPHAALYLDSYNSIKEVDGESGSSTMDGMQHIENSEYIRLTVSPPQSADPSLITKTKDAFISNELGNGSGADSTATPASASGALNRKRTESKHELLSSAPADNV